VKSPLFHAPSFNVPVDEENRLKYVVFAVKKTRGDGYNILWSAWGFCSVH